ncbi:succinate dehydrogenase assembly factor 4, mitochondrial [Eucalyptus grandis]|uniref:succinate dehydrogenase assembly factor 4, mitochondrial n=1 Tax=Eucalyptus grandis TaxID=71139 RepID=UPI00192E9369|nr:succinate dehydrogenase assembly factor 4, mitochondrial [Eucalyptus grandis]
MAIVNLGRRLSASLADLSAPKLALARAVPEPPARSVAGSAAARLFGSSTEQPPRGGGNNPSGRGQPREDAAKGIRQQQEEEEPRGEGEEEEEEEDDDGYMNRKTGEIGGPRGPEPTRYGDWERNGRCSDF